MCGADPEVIIKMIIQSDNTILDLVLDVILVGDEELQPKFVGKFS